MAQWSTIRTVLILALIYDLASKQIDFTNAFAQAFLKEEVYVGIPQGFSKVKGEDRLILNEEVTMPTQIESRDYALKLNKSLYGLV